MRRVEAQIAHSGRHIVEHNLNPFLFKVSCVLSHTAVFT
jgi:hypothetical protein